MANGWIVPDWPAPVSAAVSTRLVDGASQPPFDSFNLGTRCGDDPDHVAANRLALIDALGLQQSPCWLRQVHGTTVVRLSSSPEPVEHEADAAVASEPGVVLAILTADCLPVLFASRDGIHIGAAHAGWRGLAAGVLEATVTAMDVPPSEIIAWLGPAIAADSYEVGEEVRDTFVAHDPRAEAAFTESRPGHWFCDLCALATQRLRAYGIEHIHGGGFDTFDDDCFYSYRRDLKTGRFASLIWISP
ncbi:MAG: peptidoglycan editing factor PgeF [Dokdonella sp.]